LRSIDPKASEEMTSLYRYAFDIDRTSSGHLSDAAEIAGGK
jgi:hypothetical protein